MKRADAEKIFSNELDAALEGYEVEHKLGGDVFSEKASDEFEFIVDRKEELPALGKAVAACVKQAKKRIVIIGERGVGKSTLKTILQQANGEHYYITEIDSLLYSLSNPQFKLFFGKLIAHNILSQIDDLREKGGSKITGPIIESFEKPSLYEAAICATEKKIISPNENEEMGMHYLKQLITYAHKPIVLIIDDYHLLAKNAENVASLKQIISANTSKLIPVFILPTSEYTEIKQNNPDLFKDTAEVVVNPLTIEDLYELIRRRILYYRVKSFSESESEKDTLPFTREALEAAGILAKGNPLEFIKLCHNLYDKAREQKERMITKDFINKFALKINPLESITNVPEKQKQIFSILLQNLEGLTTSELSEKLFVRYGQNKVGRKDSSANLIQVLNKMLEKNLVRKERRNKFVFYIPVLQQKLTTNSPGQSH